MSDRFHELLAKGRDGQLTPGETEELARLLNAPLLDPLTNPTPGYVSKHNFPPTDVIGRVRAVDWFARVGEPLAVDLTMPVEHVGSWAEAAAGCRELAWENAQLEGQNQLTVWLHQHDRANYQKWNEVVGRYWGHVLTPMGDDVLLPLVRRLGVDAGVVQSVQMDLLGALMEEAYRGSGHRSFFFTELLGVYEAGHLPCGWSGEWPAGTLLVY